MACAPDHQCLWRCDWSQRLFGQSSSESQFGLFRITARELGQLSGQDWHILFACWGPSLSEILEMVATGWRDGDTSNDGEAQTFSTPTVNVSGSIDPACNFTGSVSPFNETTYSALVDHLEGWENEDDHFPDTYTEVQEWIYICLQILEVRERSHDAYAKGKVFIKRITKKSEIRLGVNLGVLPGYPATDYSPTSQYMNSWVWKV